MYNAYARCQCGYARFRHNNDWCPGLTNLSFRPAVKVAAKR